MTAVIEFGITSLTLLMSLFYLAAHCMLFCASCTLPKLTSLQDLKWANWGPKRVLIFIISFLMTRILILHFIRQNCWFKNLEGKFLILMLHHFFVFYLMYLLFFFWYLLMIICYNLLNKVVYLMSTWLY